MVTQNRSLLKRLPMFAAGAASLALFPMASHASVSFLGIASGDATTNDAIVWTRAVDSSSPTSSVNLTLQISTDSTLSTGVTTVSGSTNTTADYTLKLDVSGLSPATVYYYRFVGPSGELSDIGRFKTPPLATVSAPLTFAFSGDCDGLIRPYTAASQMRAKNLDFFMFDGDTIYETSASIGSPAVASTGSIPTPSSSGANKATLYADFSRKYREQYVPVNAGGQACLKDMYAAQGNYTMLDNHELGNKQYINGGAPAGGAVGDNLTGAGVDARDSSFDSNLSTSGTAYMNRSTGFSTLIQAYLDHQPINDRGTISAPTDARTNGTKQLYFAQQWGKNAILINVDDRSYRDIRIKTSGGADDTGSRADSTSRSMLGTTQLAWLEKTLLDAQAAGTTWKFVNISDPIDQIGPIGGALNLQNAPTVADYGTLGTVTSVTVTAASTASKTATVASAVGVVVGQPVTGTGVPANTFISSVNPDGTLSLTNNSTLANGAVLTLTPAASTYAPVSADGGKSWSGEYRAERNALLKFIADHQIVNVVFMATDDHQNRVNEVTYSPTGATGVQSSYVKVPYCFSIVCGPLGATGPDFISNHTFGLQKKLADSIANAEVAAGVEPIGLAGYPGLHNVTRLNDPSADSLRQPVDFYSPDTNNYNTLSVSADGKTLTVKSYGIYSTVQNAFSEYDAVNNPEQVQFSFQVDAAAPLNNIDHIVVVYQENWSFDGLYGSFPGANGVASASATSLNQLTIGGTALSTLSSSNGYVNPSRPLPVQNPPAPLVGGSYVVDTRFLTDTTNTSSATKVNTLLPYVLTAAPLTLASTDLTGDIFHRYWQEQFQINGGANNKFVSWSDNPGLVMSRFDATNLPEGLLAQQYTMCDNLFHSAFGGSFLNHQFLVAAVAPVWATSGTSNLATLAGDGTLSLTGAGKIIHDGSVTPIGGPAYNFPGVTFDKQYAVNTTFSVNLQSHGGNPTASNLLPSQTSPTIGDSLNTAGVSWKWYSGGYENALQSSPTNPITSGTLNTVDPLFQWHHQAFAYFENFKPFDASKPDGRNPMSAAHLQDEANFFTDVANNALPAVSFIKPVGGNNEHPGYAALQAGQQHVADIVKALQANPAVWAHTMVIVTYDEHGGRWDHVAPFTRDIWGPGVRVPGIVISPFAKSGYVDHTRYETCSVLKTIEERFGLPALNAVDGGANSFAPALTNLAISRGSFTLNRRTNTITQIVTVKNQATVPMVGPISLVLDNVSANTSVVGQSGVTANNAPLGSPYVTVSAADLAPGASASVTLQFANPTSGGVQYNARTVTGAFKP